jgi:hypothetical protein
MSMVCVIGLVTAQAVAAVVQLLLRRALWCCIPAVMHSLALLAQPVARMRKHVFVPMWCSVRVIVYVVDGIQQMPSVQHTAVHIV